MDNCLHFQLCRKKLKLVVGPKRKIGDYCPNKIIARKRNEIENTFDQFICS